MGRSRYYATYEELFNLHLSELLERGGTVYVMVDLAKAYEGKDGVLRKNKCEDWILQTAAFSCVHCGTVFNPVKPDEDDEVICSFCKGDD